MAQRIVQEKKYKSPRKRVDSTRSCEEVEVTHKTTERRKEGRFVFPPPPPPPLHFTPRRSVSASSYYYNVSDSDSQSESGVIPGKCSPVSAYHPLFTFHSFQSNGSPVALHSLPRSLPPIGVFWDIENCQVPKGKSAVAVAQVIRDKFFTGYREAEFLVVCDVKKENSQVIQELNDAQVNLIHVASTCKNAADEKLRQSIRRFADIHGSPAAIILITGDINFAADLSDLRHRKKIHVILLHNTSASEALILCASEHYNFPSLMEDLPMRSTAKSVVTQAEILISNLPEDRDHKGIRARLKQLSSNCGGRVGVVHRSFATVRFSSLEFAARAQKRMDGEDVFGRKIVVSYPTRVPESHREDSPTKNLTVTRKSKLREESENELPWSTVSFCNSNPPALNVLSSIPISATLTNLQQNSDWKRISSLNRNLFTTFPFQHVDTEEPHWMNPAFNLYQHSSVTEEQQKNKEQSTTEAVGANVSMEKTPDGMRRIRGTHKASLTGENGGIVDSSQSSLSLSSSKIPYYKPPGAVRRSQTPTFGGTGMYSYTQMPAMSSTGPIMNRKCRTPSPYTVKEDNRGWQPYRRRAQAEGCENQCYFHSISSKGVLGSSDNISTPIELQVTNLDQNMDVKELKNVLSAVFREQVSVLHVSIFMQSDGNYAAYVKVPSLQDAQYAISQLHRRKVGYKRILISYANTGGPRPQLIRSQIISLLLEVPGHRLPLFKFRELFENRYLTSVSVSDMYKMKDVCLITEDSSGRMVSLNPDHRNTPSPSVASDSQSMELPYCVLHANKPGSDKGWAEQDAGVLPNVRIGLGRFTLCIEELLHSHNGSLPLPSLPLCYEAKFQHLPVDEGGVPLEHLVSCIPSVELYQGVGCVKYLRWKEATADKGQAEDPIKSISPPLATQLALFSRELVDLLKTSQYCQLPFNKFIPAYHHHFGRQCRVADYGFTKLIELMEALPHIVQVLGEGNKKVITLSHKAQIRRFTSDLLRVLKSQASKQVAVSEFPQVYQRVLGRPWNIVDYGLCELGDMLAEVSENTVVVTPQENDVIISIPKREQTLEEKEKTRQFAGEVVELLRHAPQCSMLFSKFIPAYHHHYGHQCRVADYGFTKLIELFQAIPEVAKVEEDGEGERRITLALQEKLRILAEQIVALVRSTNHSALAISALQEAFLKEHGYALRPEAYECSTLEQLIDRIHHAVKLVPSQAGPKVVLVDRGKLFQLSLQVRRVLMETPEGKMTVGEFLRMLWHYYNLILDIERIERDLNGTIEVVRFPNGETFVHLTPLQKFAKNAYQILFENNGRLSLSAFGTKYVQKFGVPCQPAQYGYLTMHSLLQSIPETVIIRGRANRRILLLNKHLAVVGIPLPENFGQSVSKSSDECSQVSNGDSEHTASETNSQQSTSEDEVALPESILQEQQPLLSDSMAEKFLQSIICNGMQHEPGNVQKADSSKVQEHYSESFLDCAERRPLLGSMWGGSSPPHYTPYGHSTAFMESTAYIHWPHHVPDPLPDTLSPPFLRGTPLPLAPDPSELPLPQLSLATGIRPTSPSKNETEELKKEGNEEACSTSATGDSLDCSVSNVSIEMLESEQNTPNRTKRKRRLAAQFNTPLEML